MVENSQTKEIISVDFAVGGTHDFKLFKNSKIKIHKNCVLDVDSGYQGAKNTHKNTNLPIKKKRKPKQSKEEKKKAKKQKLTKAERRKAKLLLLSKEDRLKNKELAKNRVGIEHQNRKFKIFKIVQQTYRSHTKFGMRVTLIATLINANIFFFNIL